jgi:hypothetical protein
VADIDFWYSIGSTNSYLTVMRLADVEKASGLAFRWRPFNVRHVMVAQNNVPFKDKPVKTAYMWRDIERRARRYGLTPRIPAPYPLPGLVLANQPEGDRSRPWLRIARCPVGAHRKSVGTDYRRSDGSGCFRLAHIRGGSRGLLGR